MIHIKIIHRILGVLLLIESGILLLCTLLPIFYNEDDLFGFIMASLLTACSGLAFMIIGKSARHNEGAMTRRDGYIIVVTSWILFSIFGSLPYYVSRYIPNFTDAFLKPYPDSPPPVPPFLMTLRACRTDCCSGAA